MSGCIKTLEQFMRYHADSLHDQWDMKTDKQRSNYAGGFVEFANEHWQNYQKSIEDSF